jgi:hypothetical protein
MAKRKCDKKISIDLQNIHIKLKMSNTNPIKNREVNSGRASVPDPLVAPVVLFCLQTRW